ncbi:hypothetical protein DRW03_05615 [Corallococcus sp. H22C18031201]|nr:hypothetical protein DRW03_05615 [Corallococcus sp. H22C18031201]
MTTTAIPSSVSVSASASSTREDGLERWAIAYARIALGVAFLSAVASRFGLWSGEPWGPRFERFIAYTAQVNAFAPAACIPFLAWVATLAETTLGTLLVLGLWRRHVAFASAALLAVFGTAMAVSLGPKEPLDYSVYSASAGALLLALASRRK